MQIRANDSNILLSHLKFIKLLGELFINAEVVIFSLQFVLNYNKRTYSNYSSIKSV